MCWCDRDEYNSYTPILLNHSEFEEGEYEETKAETLAQVLVHSKPKSVCHAAYLTKYVSLTSN